MPEDRIAVRGEQLTAQVQSSWTQFIEDVGHARNLDQVITMLTKHVRHAEERQALTRRARTIFSKRLPRQDAELLLERFYIRLAEAVAQSYDRLSPLVFPALQSASNSQILRFPTAEIVKDLYG